MFQIFKFLFSPKRVLSLGIIGALFSSPVYCQTNTNFQGRKKDTFFLAIKSGYLVKSMSFDHEYFYSYKDGSYTSTGTKSLSGLFDGIACDLSGEIKFINLHNQYLETYLGVEESIYFSLATKPDLLESLGWFDESRNIFKLEKSLFALDSSFYLRQVFFRTFYLIGGAAISAVLFKQSTKVLNTSVNFTHSGDSQVWNGVFSIFFGMGLILFGESKVSWNLIDLRIMLMPNPSMNNNYTTLQMKSGLILKF